MLVIAVSVQSRKNYTKIAQIKLHKVYFTKMKKSSGLLRNAHFLGTKVRNLRKGNNMTMEDLSARCIKLNAEAAPSVSYLSMIERGKRVPSMEVLTIIANVFQQDVSYFHDDVPDAPSIVPDKGNRGGISGMALEPGFLFSDEILQIAIPEMLSQAGVSGRQFAHLLIRAHQEKNQNHFPELERAAEAVGGKQLPLSLDALMDIVRSLGMQVKWFTRVSKKHRAMLSLPDGAIVRSFFEAPGTIYLNRLLTDQHSRAKYDLGVYIAHKVLHNAEGLRSIMHGPGYTGGGLREGRFRVEENVAIDSKEIVRAWRDFECSFFAGALLCPKVPFRRILEREAHEISVGEKLGVSASVVMRRMTAVSTYQYWHYFDAYPPGRLHAVYRGNGIPLPWGNMTQVDDPCQHWAVFRMIDSQSVGSSAQLSLLETPTGTRIYACESIRIADITGLKHVLCAGIDLNPAITAQGGDAATMAEELKEACQAKGGTAAVPKAVQPELTRIGRILNIGWIERAIEKDVRHICPRSSACPRQPVCQGIPQGIRQGSLQGEAH